jgi:hydrogenase maturation factor
MNGLEYSATVRDLSAHGTRAAELDLRDGGAAGPDACGPRGCSICRDSAARVRLDAVLGCDGIVTDETGTSFDVALDLVPGAVPGDELLVHLGVAISRLERGEAGESCDRVTDDRRDHQPSLHAQIGARS